MTDKFVANHETIWAATLVIGDMDEWRRMGRVLPEIDGFHFVDIDDVNPDYIRELDPAVILSSLMGYRFDALEIARILGDMDYRGSYRVLTNDIPNTSVVLSEVYQIAPYLDFDVINLGALFPEL